MPVGITQMLGDGGVVALLLDRALQPSTALSYWPSRCGPADAVGDRAVVGPQWVARASTSCRPRDAGPGRSSLAIVQHMRLFGESSSAFFMSASASATASSLEHDAAAEIHRPMALIDRAQPRDRRIVGFDGVGVALLAAQQVGKGEGGINALGLLRHQGVQAGDRLVELFLLGVERRRAQPRLPVERRRRADLRAALRWLSGSAGTARTGWRSSARRNRGRASGRQRSDGRSERGRCAGCAGRRPGCRRCRT